MWMKIHHMIHSLITNDAFYFYVETIAHLRDTRPSWKNSTPTQFFTKCMVLYSKSIHNTQNQPSQPAIYTLFKCLRPLIAKLPDEKTFIIKQGRSTCFAFFDFLIFSGEHSVYCTHQNLDQFVNIKTSLMETLIDLQLQIRIAN